MGKTMGTANQSVIDQSAVSSSRLQAMLQICQKLNSERDLFALLDLIAQEATRLMDAERASIFLLDRAKLRLRSKVALGSCEILEFDARKGIAGAAALTGETINVRDVAADTRFYAEMDARTGYKTHTLLAVPLRNYHDEIIGTFEVLNKRRGVFDRDDEETAGSLATHAAIAIETAQMLADLRRNRDQLVQENSRLWREVEGRFATQTMMGTSEKIQRVLRLVEQISDSSVNVLITGESGTGKELVAKAIHFNSPRAREAFVALNCAALPDSLIESELFGVEKGVATGVAPRMGKFEAADRGTLFLDEIGDLSLTAQAKILRVLQERVVDRLGSRKPVPVDVRVLAATNKDLEAAIRNGTFREDLFYRLKVIHIHLPPLRAIAEDIPLLAEFFLAQYANEMNKPAMQLAPSAIECLNHYSWPGNVRELENEMRRLVVCVRQHCIAAGDLADPIREQVTGRSPNTAQPLSLKHAVEELEKRHIRAALDACGQNQLQTAKRLGLSRQGLIKKMQRYGINRSWLREQERGEFM